jgi:DNA-binding MarR family transcriptional regulator
MTQRSMAVIRAGCIPVDLVAETARQDPMPTPARLFYRLRRISNRAINRAEILNEGMLNALTQTPEKLKDERRVRRKRPTGASSDTTDDARVYMRISDAWRELRRGSATRAYKDLLFGGLDHAAVDVVDFLSERPEWRMSDLAVALRVERSTMTRAIDRLERSGLAQRRTVLGAADGKSVRVRLTRGGKALHKTIAANREKLVMRMVDDFDFDEVKRLADLMTRLVAGYDRVVGEADGDSPNS